MSNELNPDMLAYLDAERQFNEQRGGGKTRRVKIEKVNQAWLVRFLPIALGQSSLFYVRQGQHWHNKTPIVCPRWASVDFGGDENADCPVCELSDRLNAEDHEEVSKFGWGIRAQTTWITYCLVYQVDPGRGEITELSSNEVLRPWEFNLYKGTFEELSDYFRRGRTASRPWSVLDPKKGNDFWATKTNKGIRLDRQDPQPMFSLDGNFDKSYNTVMNAVAEPKIKIPTSSQLAVFARKAEAAAYGEDEPVHAIRGRRSDLEENEPAEEPQERLSRTLGRNAPLRGMARRQPQIEEPPPEPEIQQPVEQPAESESVADEEQQRQVVTAEVQADTLPDAIADEQKDEQDQVPGAEVPSQRPAPTRTAPPASKPMQRVTSPVTARPASVVSNRAIPPAAAVAAGVRRPAPATTAPARRPAPAAPAVTGRPAPAAAPVRETVNEEEDPGVAEESSDQAGPAETPLQEQSGEEAPPAPAPARPTARPGPAAAGPNAGLRARLAQRIQTAGSK